MKFYREKELIDLLECMGANINTLIDEEIIYGINKINNSLYIEVFEGIIKFPLLFNFENKNYNILDIKNYTYL